MMIFDIINFAIRIIIVVYIVYRYVIPLILKAMHHEVQALILLDERKDSLYKAYNLIQNNMQDMQNNVNQLEQKFKIWNHQVAALKVEQTIWCQAQEKKIIQKLELKKKYLEQQSMIQEEIPEIVEQVTKQLQQKFKKDSVLAKQHQADLIEFLNK